LIGVALCLQRHQQHQLQALGINHLVSLVSCLLAVCSLDVDKEFWEVLDLCSDDELECIYNILHGASPFSPVVKSIVREDEPPLLQLRGRTSIMHKVQHISWLEGAQLAK
jgi:hypothetical protein